MEKMPTYENLKSEEDVRSEIDGLKKKLDGAKDESERIAIETQIANLWDSIRYIRHDAENVNPDVEKGT